MLKIKLSMRGKRNQRTFRIIVAEAQSKRDGKYIDELGFWNPHTEEFKVDKKKLKKWLSNGAQLTQGTKKLLADQKISI
jgi:small subunit ribosomal protein S16